ncbi:MAG: putative bifunctional diguanylate cyclase/phosphodiesterase, partial [Gammaproteobacteria bacterium]
ALIFFDIDHFKNINDSSGHSVGDELLVKVAEKLISITRESDIVARFGGDEFVVLAPHIDQPHAVELVKKICHEMAMVEINVGKIQLRVSVSAGLLVFPVPDASGYSDQDLMASVDMAMYKAKALGRGGWCMASVNDMHRKEVRHTVNWKSKIEKALDEDRFLLYFQPIQKISDRSIAHYECLLRMIDENGDIILPGLFTAVAEQTGLIHKIDLRVLDLAFKSQAQFLADGFEIKLSINLSSEMLSNPDAFNIISALLKKWKVPASMFIFEVIETQAVTNLQSAHKLIQKIAEIGGKFALDDFGVGFSSMSYLKLLPVHFLKIDGSFIKNLADSHEDHLFVNAINNVGQGMGLVTIAEFVENNRIMDELIKIGVDYAQGFAIGKPLPIPEFHDKTKDVKHQKS